MTTLTKSGSRRRVLRVAALVAAIGIIGACGSDDGDDDAAPTTTAGSSATTAATAGNTEVVTLDFEFQNLTVAANQPITVTNEGDAPHTLTSADDSFEEVVVQPGESMTLDGLAPGTYQIVCRFHEGRGMTGTLTVQ